VVELLWPEERQAHPRLSALGPDLLKQDLDRDEVWRRLARDSVAPLTIAEAILDQTVIAGIGNIYKSEGLFLAGIDPYRTVQSLERPQIEQLWNILIPLMKKGARQSGPVITRTGVTGVSRKRIKPSDRHWVYQRQGKNCYLCGMGVRMIRQGKNRRTTFFCPLCQKPGQNRPAVPSLFPA
jgi:formamidopyrimidine-DNA glycosylase